MFDEISNWAQEQEITFSLYVDDLTFSSTKKLPSNIEQEVTKIIRRCSLGALKLSRKKTQRYSPLNYKLVTGVIINPAADKLLIRNKIRHKIELIKGSNKGKEELKSLIGLIQHAQCIEKGYEGNQIKYYRNILSSIT